MTQKVITKKSFIGGRLVYPGELVDVDAQGAILPAGSTPVDQLTDDQLLALVVARQGVQKTGGDNVADPANSNTGVQAAAFANVSPSSSGARPQVIPPGTEEHAGAFLHPAPDAAPSAIEQVIAPGGDVDKALAPEKRARKSADG